MKFKSGVAFAAFLLLAIASGHQGKGASGLKKVSLDDLATRYPEAAERLKGEYFGKQRLVGTEVIVINLTGSTATFDFQDDAWLPTTLRQGAARVFPRAQGLMITNGDKSETIKIKAGARIAIQRQKDTKRIYLEEVVAN